MVDCDGINCAKDREAPLIVISEEQIKRHIDRNVTLGANLTRQEYFNMTILILSQIMVILVHISDLLILII